MEEYNTSSYPAPLRTNGIILEAEMEENNTSRYLATLMTHGIILEFGMLLHTQSGAVPGGPR
jgi:hypothetical protein